MLGYPVGVAGAAGCGCVVHKGGVQSAAFVLVLFVLLVIILRAVAYWLTPYPPQMPAERFGRLFFEVKINWYAWSSWKKLWLRFCRSFLLLPQKINATSIIREPMKKSKSRHRINERQVAWWSYRIGCRRSGQRRAPLRCLPYRHCSPRAMRFPLYLAQHKH